MRFTTVSVALGLWSLGATSCVATRRPCRSAIQDARAAWKQVAVPLPDLEAELGAAPADDRAAFLEATHTVMGQATTALAWLSGAAVLDAGSPRQFARHPELVGLLQVTNDACAPAAAKAKVRDAVAEMGETCAR